MHAGMHACMHAGRQEGDRRGRRRARAVASYVEEGELGAPGVSTIITTPCPTHPPTCCDGCLVHELTLQTPQGGELRVALAVSATLSQKWPGGYVCSAGLLVMVFSNRKRYVTLLHIFVI